MNLSSSENKIHFVFEASIVTKGIFAIVEILGGALTFFVNGTYVINTILYFTQEELSEDPKDVIAHYIFNIGNNLSIGSQHFVALYLISHGAIKLFLIIGLIKKKMWAYPTSIVVFGSFIVYQAYRYTNTHSIWLLVLTLFDIAIIWLTAHEYKYMKKYNLFKNK